MGRAPRPRAGALAFAGPFVGLTSQELWPPTRTATSCKREVPAFAKSSLDAEIGFVPSEAPCPARSLGACMGARRSTGRPCVATPLLRRNQGRRPGFGLDR